MLDFLVSIIGVLAIFAGLAVVLYTASYASAWLGGWTKAELKQDFLELVSLFVADRGEHHDGA